MQSAKQYLHSLRAFHWILFAVVAVATFTVVYEQITTADCYPGTTLGRRCYRGYFSNTEDRGGTDVLPVISGGLALPNNINTAQELYDLLRSAYNSGNNQKRTGAAFIYNTMMGEQAPGTGRTVSNSEWQDLRQRLIALDQAGKIRWRGNVSVSVNSYWQGTDEGFARDGRTNDDAYYRNYKNESGISIRDYNNKVVYEILRRCANPIGEPDGIPAARNYTLTPHITDVSPDNVEPGGKVSATGSVDNVGDVVSGQTRWEITKIVVQPGKKAPHEDENGTTSGEAPCEAHGGGSSGNYFDSADADCENSEKGTGVFNRGTPAQNLQPSALGKDVGDLPVGARICFALSVQPRSNTSTNWAHSKPICTVVGKKPKIQVWGNDISVRGEIETSTSSKTVDGASKIFGSWVEYGAFSVDTNSRFASGSGLNNQTNTSQSAWSKLTFANKDENGADAFGSFSSLAGFRPVPGVAAYFDAVQNKQPVGSGSVDVGSLAFDTGSPVRVRTANNLTITGGNLSAGKSVVIVATGTVTIDGNITYTDASLGRVRDIPQVVIIARNINIRDNVSRVDSWLVDSSTINTCHNFSGKLTSEKCKELLEVNGPVITDRLLLNRTAGSGTEEQSDDPAEKFNLRPDAFLWAQLQATGNSKAQTVYSTELPPRF